MKGDFWRGTDFQRQILGIKGIDVDNPQMISLEPGPCHLQNKVYRGFNTNQNLSLDMTKSIHYSYCKWTFCDCLSHL